MKVDQYDMNNMGYPSGNGISPFPAQTPLAMAYVPYQNMSNVYDPDRALMVGTIYPELDKPWLDGKAYMGKDNSGIMGDINKMGTMGAMNMMPNPNMGTMGAMNKMPDPNMGTMGAMNKMPDPNMGTMGAMNTMPNPNTGTMGAMNKMPDPNMGTMGTMSMMPDPNMGTMGAMSMMPDPNMGSKKKPDPNMGKDKDVGGKYMDLPVIRPDGRGDGR